MKRRRTTLSNKKLYNKKDKIVRYTIDIKYHQKYFHNKLLLKKKKKKVKNRSFSRKNTSWLQRNILKQREKE